MEKKNVKIQVYVPQETADELRLAIGNAGGGKIGNYSHAAFTTAGKGYFMPLQGSNPAIGSQGKIEEVNELKIEFICRASEASEIIAVIRDVHPYEEPAIDILPLIELE